VSNDIKRKTNIYKNKRDGLMAERLPGAAFVRDAGLKLRLFPRKTAPLILQHEAAECGLACLAMVAQHYGASLQMEDLRAQFDVSSRGTSLQDMGVWADKIGLNARCVELGADEISQLKLPAVLHWAGNHWVVVTQASAKGLQLHDPAMGRRWVSWREVQEKFSGFAADFVPRAQLQRTPPQPRLQFGMMMRSFPGMGSAVFQLFMVSVVLEIIALLTPYYTLIVLDHVLVTGDKDLLSIVALGTGFLLVFQTIFTAIRGWAGVMLSQNVGYQLYVHVIRHLFKLPVQFFVKRQTGDLVSRFDSLGQLAQALTRTSIEIVLDALISVGTVAMMFLYSSTLAWLAIGVFTLMLTVKVFVFSSSQRVTAERVFLDAKRQSHLIESVRGVHALKMAGADLTRAQQWTNLTRRAQDKDASTERINLFSNLVMTTCTGLAHLMVVYLAAQMILANQLSVGMLFAFMAYQGSFASRASAFADRMLWLRTMKVHFDRTGDIVFAQPENDQGVALSQKPKASSLQAVNLGYKYAAPDPPIFRAVSFSVEASEIVAIVGPSGTGKTTLLCVLGGVFMPGEGSLSYDGERMQPSNALALRKRLAFVFQSDELFEGSIEENIAFFAQPIDRERTKLCAQLACISHEIESWPQNYRTRLAEQGAGISGGQRQRILIARALYREPSMLILDEATSQLDVATEKRVLENLKTLGITIIMSAHRPDAIAFAGRIYSMQTKNWLENKS
jgi:ATP-binding cassette, subfamily B, bacterial CvaB/MchF/RaxB